MALLQDAETASLFEKMQGEHVVYIEDETGKVPFHFKLVPDETSAEQLMMDIKDRAVLTNMPLHVRLRDIEYKSKKSLPILIAHGIQLGQEHHINTGDGVFIQSERAVKAVSDWLATFQTPTVKIFVSCDRALPGQEQFRHWINDPKKGVLGFEGDAYWADIENTDTSSHALVIPLEEMKNLDNIHLKSPFQNDADPSRWIVNELFTVESKNPIVLNPRVSMQPQIILRKRGER